MRDLPSTLKKLLTVFKRAVSPLDAMPDFQNFQYHLATIPSGSKIRAWSKLGECERRLEMYKWVASLNDPRKAQHRILLNDTVSAFLLTFEATIQFVGDQLRWSASELGNWIAGQPQYNVTLRGLRTLRHFEAHAIFTDGIRRLGAILRTAEDLVRE